MKTDIKFEANGRTYSVSMSANALCLLEDAFGGQGFHNILSAWIDPKKITMTNVRKLFWCSLTDNQPEITEKEAGELIAAVGGLAPTLEMVSSALVESGIAAFEQPTAKRKK
ncbi:MAG: hypothetical protein OJF48_001925 [Afipia sp.]|jgi:hypothetical protein|nr:MAG: hypothetical protein OJF48_001925 [Afipia sp.]